MNKKVIKKKLVLKTPIKKTLNKLLLTIIIFLIGMIAIKQSPDKRNLIKTNVYEESLKFTKVKKLYNKYFGNVFSIDKLLYEELPVFNEEITYTAISTYKDGVALTVAKNYMIPAIASGIVVYIGNKEEYGQTLIIEQENGIDVFYSNITTNNIKLYDYIEKGSYIGEAKSEKIYLVFQKDGKVLNYKDYL